MKIRIELIENLTEDEVLIRCGRVDDTIQKIQQYIVEQSSLTSKMIFYKDNQEFYFPLSDILFFETEGERIFGHTSNDNYRIKYRLYELNKILPRHFVRASKSTIINVLQVYSVSRNITSSSLVEFKNSHKHIYLSRHYYNEVRQRLNERSSYEK